MIIMMHIEELVQFRKPLHYGSVCSMHLVGAMSQLKGFRANSRPKKSILFSLARNVEGVGGGSKPPRLRLCIPAFILRKI